MLEQAPDNNVAASEAESPLAVGQDANFEDAGTEAYTDYKRSGYLDTMPDDERQEIINTSVAITEAIPGSVLYGGNALRMGYEARTGKPMFGTGKGDHDVYVPRGSIAELRANPPEGYTINTDPQFMPVEGQDEDGYVVLVDSRGQHIDVFGRDGRKSEVVEIDGHKIPVLALEELISDKLNLALQTNGYKDLPEKDRNRHGFYAARLLEMAEAGEVDESLLLEGWREDLKAIAAQAEFAEVELTTEEESRYREKMLAHQETEAKKKAIEEALIGELHTVYDAAHQVEEGVDSSQSTQQVAKSQALIESFMPDDVPKIVEAAVRNHSADAFLTDLRDALGSSAHSIGEKIEASVR